MKGLRLYACTALCLGVALASRADVVWYYGDNTATNLEAQTGQSSGGVGLSVDWKDAAIKLTAPNQVGGERADIGVIQYQSVPPLQSHALFSFNDVFGEGPLQISNNMTVVSATLWLHVTQVERDQTISLRGIQWSDRDWLESESSYALKDESMSTTWFGGGNFGGSLVNNYGTINNPTATGWFSVDLTAALNDYKNGQIGGVVLVASSSSTEEIRNFYFDSDEALDGNLRPGLYVNFAIPEPGSLFLMGLGGLLAFFKIQRRRK